MQVKNLEKKEKSVVTFEVLVSAEEFDKAIQTAYLKNRGKIYLPGFRKGKAPRQVIEGMYGKDVFYQDAADELAPAAFQFGVDDQKLRNVGSPAMTAMNVSDDKELTLGFQTAVWPEAKLGEYKGLKAERPDSAVKDEDVDAEVTRAQKRAGRVVTVEREAKMGDTAVIDFEGSVDGVPFEGGKSEGHSLVLGSNVFIPGFEEQVVGMKAGEEKDINVTFPEDYQAEELKGKAAVFHIKCNEVKEEQLPALDDEFAKDVSEFDTLAEYKQSIRDRLQKNADEAADAEFHNALLEQAAENMEVEVPQAMIEEQVDNMVNELAQNLQYQGLSIEMYLQYMGQDVKTFRESQKEQAEKRCRLQILVDKIAEVEDIQISDEDVAAEYERIADQYSTSLETVKGAVPEDAVRDDMRAKKAAELVYESGVAGKPAKKTAKKAPAKKAEAETEEKPAAKKAPAKKATAKKAEAEAEEKSAAKKAPAKKAPAKKAEAEAEEKPAAKKPAAKKAAAEKTEEKPAAKKAPAKKAPAKKAETEEKPAAKKPAAKKTAKKADAE